MNKTYKVNFASSFGGDMAYSFWLGQSYAEVEQKFYAKYTNMQIISIEVTAFLEG